MKVYGVSGHLGQNIGASHLKGKSGCCDIYYIWNYFDGSFRLRGTETEESLGTNQNKNYYYKLVGLVT